MSTIPIYGEEYPTIKFLKVDKKSKRKEFFNVIFENKNVETNVSAELKELKTLASLVNVINYTSLTSIYKSQIDDISIKLNFDIVDAISKPDVNSCESNLRFYKAKFTILETFNEDYELLIDRIEFPQLKIKANSNEKKQFRFVFNYHQLPSISFYIVILWIIFVVFIKLHLIILHNTIIIDSALFIIIIFILLRIYYEYNISYTKKYSYKSLFMNGWNAWSYAGSIMQGTLPPIYALPDKYAKSFHHGTSALLINQNSRHKFIINRSDDYIGSDMFTLISNRLDKSGIIIGFLSQKQSYGYMRINYDYNQINITCDCDDILVYQNFTIETDWLLIQTQKLLSEDPFNYYYKSIALYHNLPNNNHNISEIDNLAHSQLPVVSLPIPVSVPVGWCSWYHFYENISHEILSNNIQSMKINQIKHNIPSFQLFQIGKIFQSLVSCIYFI